jgi:hypothetical protein
MACDVVNIKVCNPLKQRSCLTGNCHAICHYSYNLPLSFSRKKVFSSHQRLVLHAKAINEKYLGVFKINEKYE